MKLRRLSVAVLIFSAMLPGAAAQEAIPTTASVSANDFPPLRAGDDFTFHLTLNKPPHRYDEGTIDAWFECEPVSLDRFTGPEEEWCRRPASVKAVDGKTSYDIKLKISEPMKPGKWKLVSLDLEQAGAHTLTFSGGATFEVAHLHPMMVTDVQHPQSVEAGERFAIKVILGEGPGDTYNDCATRLGVLLNPGPHEQTSDQQIEPNQRSYEFYFRYYPDTPSGHVEGKISYSGEVVGNGDHLVGCRYPELKDNPKFGFDLAPAPDLQTPTSAEVTVTHSQADLLKTSAAKIQVQLKELKATLASNAGTANGSVAAVARENIEQALRALDDTQSSFHKLAVTPKQTYREQVFFDDIRAAYKDALSKLDKNSRLSVPDISVESEHLVETSDRLIRPQADLAALIKDILNPFEQNELAYIIVASTESLVFDLTVKSDPQGAAVCYYRKGDSRCENADTTNTIIPSLTYAVWYVRFQMNGFEMKEKKHNPFTEPNHVVEVIFRH